MRKYVKIGITDIAIVTNLPRENLEKMNNALKIQLGNSPLPVNYWLISGNTEELIGFLNSLAERISKTISKEFSKAFEETVPVEAQPVEEGPDKETAGHTIHD